MKPTLLVYVLGFLLILVTAGLVIQSCENKKLNRENGNTKRLLIRSQRMTEKKIDSMIVEQKILEAKSRVLELRYEASQKERDKRHAEANEWRKKYANVKNTPVPDWNFGELDTLILSITR